MDQRDGMRAADSDREVVAERLRTALNEGRLDLHEYDERLQRAFSAKTYGELNGLLTDLPGTVPLERSQVVPVAEKVVYPNVTRAWLAETWSAYFVPVFVTTVIWGITSAAAGNLLYFWPMWVAGPWGAVLLVATVTGLMNGEPQKWAAKKAAKKEKKAQKWAKDRATGGRDDE